jgi:hypothetical protein
MQAQFANIGPGDGPTSHPRVDAALWSLYHVMDGFLSKTIYEAAASKAERAGATPEEARLAGDRGVERMMPPLNLAEQSSLARDRGAIGALILVRNFPNQLLNADAELLWEARNSVWAADPGWQKAKAVLGPVAVRSIQALGMVYSAHLIGRFLMGHGRQDDETTAEWAERSALAAPFYPIPFGSEVAEPVAESLVTDKTLKQIVFQQRGFAAAPAIAELERAIRDLGTGGGQRRPRRGALLRRPAPRRERAAAAVRSAPRRQYGYDLAQGNVQPRGPSMSLAGFCTGSATGRRRTRSPQRKTSSQETEPMHKRILLAALLAAAAVVRPAHATLTSTCSSSTQVGNGSTTAFTFPCKFLQNSDISVTVNGVGEDPARRLHGERRGERERDRHLRHGAGVGRDHRHHPHGRPEAEHLAAAEPEPRSRDGRDDARQADDAGAAGRREGSSASIAAFVTAAHTASNTRVSNNTFIRSNTSWYPVIQVRGDNTSLDNTHGGIVVSGNIVKVPFASGLVNAIGIEIGDGAYDFAVTGNSLAGGAMGISLSGVQYGTVAGNNIEVGDAASAAALGLDHKAIEVAGASYVTVTGNTVNGRGFLVCGVRISPSVPGVVNGLVVSGNSFTGFGPTASARVIELFGVENRVVVSNNVINANSNAEGIVVNQSTGTVVNGNQIYAALTNGIRVQDTVGATVSGNHIQDASVRGIDIISSTGVTGSNLAVTGNTVTGTTSTQGILADGYQNTTITGNAIFITGTYGVQVQASSGSVVNVRVANNDISISSEKILLTSTSTYGAGNYFETTGTGIPAGGYHTVGFTVWNTAPVAGGTPGWVCTTAGTVGTFKTMANLAP